MVVDLSATEMNSEAKKTYHENSDPISNNVLITLENTTQSELGVLDFKRIRAAVEGFFDSYLA